MIREFCAENHTDVLEAIKAGAGRIELCDNLAVGGTTPSAGVIRYVAKLCQEHHVSLMTMIRPRAGDFVYSQAEVEMMLEDIALASAYGTTGVVFGALDGAGFLAEDVVTQLMNASLGLEVTFHMAFDSIAKLRQKEAIDWLAEKGVKRILMHGGPAHTQIEDNLPWLKELINHAQGKIEILVGGGVRWDNLEAVVSQLGVNEVHGTKICQF